MTKRRVLLGQMCRVTAGDLVSLVAAHCLAQIVENFCGRFVVVCSLGVDESLRLAKPRVRGLVIERSVRGSQCHLSEDFARVDREYVDLVNKGQKLST